MSRTSMRLAVGGGVVAVVLIVVFALVAASPDDEVQASATSSTTTSEVTTTTRRPTTTTTTSTTTSTTTTTTLPPTTTTTAPPTTTTTTLPPTTTTTVPAIAQTGGWCIGDSVMLGAGPEGHGALGMCGTVDAVVGRQFSDVPGLAATAAANDPPFVVLHLGTNGSVSAGHLDAALAALASVPRVVVVTIQLYGSRSWQEPNNAVLRSASERGANVVVADWAAASDGKTGLLADDYGHTTSAGAALYAQTIAAALG